MAFAIECKVGSLFDLNILTISSSIGRSIGVMMKCSLDGGRGGGGGGDVHKCVLYFWMLMEYLLHFVQNVSTWYKKYQSDSIVLKNLILIISKYSFNVCFAIDLYSFIFYTHTVVIIGMNKTYIFCGLSDHWHVCWRSVISFVNVFYPRIAFVWTIVSIWKCCM